MARAARRQGGGTPRKGRSGRARSAPLEQLNLNAAGIDVGATHHWVAVPSDRDEQPVQRFGAFTADLYALAEWLRQCQIDTVVMESTGVYVRRITARAISLAKGTGSEGNPWVND
jgi:hypothetical protein